MACEQWRNQLDLYADGELESGQAQTVTEHLRGCSECAAEAWERVQMKRSVQMAGKRYEPSTELRQRISKSMVIKPHRQSGWLWKILALPALSLVILSVGINLYAGRESARRQRVYS